MFSEEKYNMSHPPIISNEKKDPQMKKTKVMYVNNTDFYNAIIQYKKSLRRAKRKKEEEPRIPEYIGECIWKIAQKLSTKPCFIGYSYREEMIGDAVENCILYFKDYDPDYNPDNNPNYKANPFAYFTQIIYYAFLRRISREEKNRYIIYKNFQETISNVTGNALLVDSDDNLLMSTKTYDNINVFMDRFEKKEEAKKQKRKKAKEGLAKFLE
jgi:hypothetical protein